MSDEKRIAGIVASLWQESGGPGGPLSLTACPVSGNNRVYMVTGETGQRIGAKVYFPVPDGEQDRLEAEWSFVSHAQLAAPGCAPAPIARDAASRIALYGFAEGRKLTSAEIGPDQVRAAADFIVRLNDPAFADSAARLPPAREACFSIANHLVLLDRRFARLASIPRDTAIDAEGADFAAELTRFWQAKKTEILTQADQAGWALDQDIPQAERLLSPSDFGFHNALADEAGHLVFIDFEYAGWDDVAKLAADFFYQPAIPVNRALTLEFLSPILARFGDNGEVSRRIALLHPIFGVKWCCIMMNRFLPDMAGRAAFADPHHDADQRKREQLEKARCAFDNLVSKTWLM